MSDPARAPDVPTEHNTRPARQDLPPGLTAEQERSFEQRSSVDGEAMLAWLMGEGPDPWRDESSGPV